MTRIQLKTRNTEKTTARIRATRGRGETAAEQRTKSNLTLEQFFEQ
jgi:hypothetical protein